MRYGRNILFKYQNKPKSTQSHPQPSQIAQLPSPPVFNTVPHVPHIIILHPLSYLPRLWPPQKSHTPFPKRKHRPRPFRALKSKLALDLVRHKLHSYDPADWSIDLRIQPQMQPLPFQQSSAGAQHDVPNLSCFLCDREGSEHGVEVFIEGGQGGRPFTVWDVESGRHARKFEINPLGNVPLQWSIDHFVRYDERPVLSASQWRILLKNQSCLRCSETHGDEILKRIGHIQQ